MLASYLTQVRRLVNDPNAQYFSDAALTSWINIGRSQLASISNCLMFRTPVSLGLGLSTLAYSAVTPAPTGCLLPININSVSVLNGDGSLTRLTQRPWSYFDAYCLSGPASIAAGKPDIWSVLLQGTLGTLYVSPKTDAAYTLTVEAMWEPVPLADDTTPEALPYPWTDAIPYYAAYLAFLNAQRADDAERMMAPFEQITGISRMAVTPRTLPDFSPNAKAAKEPLNMTRTNLPQAAESKRGEGSI